VIRDLNEAALAASSWSCSRASARSLEGTRPATGAVVWTVAMRRDFPDEFECRDRYSFLDAWDGFW